MTGEDRGPGGETIDLRVTLTPVTDGSVSQIWEASRDGGATWETTLTLSYDRAD